jgi:hypothetical protein
VTRIVTEKTCFVSTAFHARKELRESGRWVEAAHVADPEGHKKQRGGRSDVLKLIEAELWIRHPNAMAIHSRAKW